MHTIRAQLRQTPAALARGARRLAARAHHLGKEAGQTSVEYMGIVVVAALLVVALITSPLKTMITGIATDAISSIQSESSSAQGSGGGNGGSASGGKGSGKGSGKSGAGKNGNGKGNQKP